MLLLLFQGFQLQRFNEFKIESVNNSINVEKQTAEDVIKALKKELDSLDNQTDSEWENNIYPSYLKEIQDLETAQKNLTFFSFIRKQKIANRIEEIKNEIDLRYV